MTKPASPGARVTELVLCVFRVNGLLLTAGDRIASVSGQTSSRWQVLGALESGPRTVAQIARAMGLTRQSVQRTANLLVDDGLCTFLPNPEHARAKLLALTPKGESALRPIGQRQAAWANALARGLPTRSLETALELMTAIETRLRDDLPES